MAISKKEGDTLSITVHVTNTSTVAGTAYIRCSLVPAAATFGWDLKFEGGVSLDGSVTLNPGQTTDPEFSMTLPAGAALGMYKTIAVARPIAGGTGTAFDTFTKEDSVEIVTVPAVFTVDITGTTET